MKTNLIKKELNKNSIAFFLLNGYIPAPNTIYKNIFSLEPGHYMTINKRRITKKSYYNLENVFLRSENISEEKAIKKIHNFLVDSVKYHLISDVPIGIFLSGGIDSSAIVALSRETKQKELKTISVVFPGTAYDESKYAKIIADKFKTEHTEVEVGSKDIRKHIKKFFYYMDQPTVDGINSYFVSLAASKLKLKVALSGLGGDEIFCGYPSFSQLPKLYKISRIFSLLPFKKKIFGWLSGNSYSSKAKIYSIFSSDSFFEAYLNYRGIYNIEQIKRIADINFSISEKNLIMKDFISKISFLELTNYMSNQLLRDTDVFSMAHSLEIRVPFVDHKVIELVAKIPSKYKVGKTPKRLLTKALGNKLPKEIIYRKKQGFVFPFDLWMREELKEFIEEKLEQNITKPIQQSKLEKMIAKANYLYSSGSKDKALFLYEKIALYSEAISVYNLGVAQLKDKTYSLALETFKKAIINDEKRCVSAINAAVCSLHLKDEESFRYYIDLAHAYLAKEKNSPLYSYYYALINYYNHNYLAALSALENPTSDEYPTTQKHLRAKINALFSNDYKAIEAIEKDFSIEDSFSIALLYARVGDLTLAQKHLEESIVKNIEPIKSAIAQAIINLKAGRVATASKQIKNVTDMFPEQVYKPYPIKVKLKESLFDSTKAQLRYRDRINKAKTFNYQKIFYYSPYKIFNADQTISYIQKGNANIYIDNISLAKEYLKKSASSSSVNQGIVKAINKALSFRLREANNELQKLALLQPKHSILHYNLALTYAQMGNMVRAHKHFLLSFHLDAKNYLSGVFAVMTSQLINKESAKLLSIVKDSISLEEDSEEIDLYTTLLHISDNNFISTADWLDNDYKQSPLYLALDTIIALSLNNINIAKHFRKVNIFTYLTNTTLMFGIDKDY